MHPVSICQTFLVGLLAIAPVVVAAPIDSQGLAIRDTTDVANMVRDVPPPDELGSWEDKRAVPPPDEFGSWEDKREIHVEARHHTEAQIAAKESAAAAAAAAANQSATQSSAAPQATSQCQGKRSPHHTEAQIAAKQAAQNAQNSAPNC